MADKLDDIAGLSDDSPDDRNHASLGYSTDQKKWKINTPTKMSTEVKFPTSFLAMQNNRRTELMCVIAERHVETLCQRVRVPRQDSIP